MLLGFVVVLLAVTLALSIETLVGLSRLARLIDLAPWRSPGAPPVSIVVAARNEAAKIEGAIRSMLAQDYPALEVVVVDDRSSDETAAILARLSREESRLKVLTVTELPGGWLGKNHALQLGAAEATGDWLLFTDADVHMDPETVSRAIRHAAERNLDHLAALPDLELPGLILKGFATFFIYSFSVYVKPWKVRDPKSRFFVGVGAFNLVRRSVYEQVGGHRPIALRPDDDLKLGKILKRGGARPDVVSGSGAIQVEWYRSVAEMIGGLEKNAFASIEYNVLVSLAGGILQLAGAALPVVLVFLTTGLTQALLLAQIGVSVVMFSLLAREIRVPATVALLYPIAAVLFVFILWRTMVVNLAQGGLRWRGTFYPLKQLKANRV